MSKGIELFAKNIISFMENRKVGTNMTEALNLMQISLEDTIKTIQNSRKELK